MATIDYSQLSHLWKITQATFLVLMSAAGIVPLVVQKNAAGIAVHQEYSDGHSVQSGSLTVKSGSLAVNLRPNGDATFQGTMSGNHLYAGAMSGAGLASCSNGATSKLLWNSATNRFSCGTDQNTGTTYYAGQGLNLTAGNAFQLNTAITGASLKVSGTVSGALAIFSNLHNCTLKSSSTGNVLCGSDNNTTYQAGQGLTLNGTAFSVNISLTGSSLKFQSISGSIIRASNSLNSSGSLTVKGTSTLGTTTVPTQATTDNSTNAATTAYVTTAVANAVAGVNPATAVAAATTAASDTSGLTYANGASGIGATFTGGVNTAVTIDGITFTTLGQRLLVKNDTQSPSGADNGIYSFTQIQTAILPPIFTRASDYNTASEMNNMGAVPVVGGTVNADSSWLLTSTITTIGTDALTYTRFTFNPTTVITGGGQGLTKNGNSLVLNNTLTGSYAKYNAFSGSVVHAEKLLSSSGSLKWITTATGSSVYSSIVRAGTSLASSGTLVWEGAASGASLWVSSFNGAGLTSCTGGSNVIQWTGNRFSCASISGTTYYGGQGLTLASNVFTVNSTLTGSAVKFNSLSGSVVHAEKLLSSSGALKVLGNMSGASLNVNNLQNCTNLQTNANGRLACNQTAYITSDLAYTAAQGLTLLGGSAFRVNATLTGTTVNFQTVSGSTVRASYILTSSGTLTTTSGAYIAGNLLVAVKGPNRVGINRTSPKTTLEVGGTISGSTVVGSVNLIASGALVVYHNSTFGTLVGDTMTLNAGTWTVPNAVTWTKTSASSTAETLLTMQVSDSTSTFSILNGTSSDAAFAPTFSGTQSAGSLSTPLSFFGTKGTADGTNPPILFLARYNGGGGNTDIPGTGSMVEFRNRATTETLFYGNGDIKTKGVLSGSLLGTNNSGNNYMMGSLGIGKIAPATKLEVSGTMSGALAVISSSATFAGANITFSTSGSTIFNANSKNVDFKMNGATVAGLFYLDASTDRIGIGKADPKALLDINGTASGTLFKANTLSGSIVRVGSAPSPSCFSFAAFGTGTAMTTGSGKLRLTVPLNMSGYTVGSAFASTDQSGVGGTAQMQIRDYNKGYRKIFTTPVTIDSKGTGSNLSATPYVISATNNVVGGYDSLYIDIPSIHSTRAAKGLAGNICLYHP